MPEAEDQYFDMKDILALLVVGGFLVVLILLLFFTVPDKNHELVNSILSVWGAGGFMIIMKRLFDGTASSDTKNATIATMGAALAQATPTAPQPPEIQ